jgi:regulator of sigma E protease
LETLNFWLNVVFTIVKVAAGLGFVIFIHELGHFVLAKWNDVKVEKFSIGFGPTLFGFRRGETQYVLALVPLGGFVKMLGEGPDEEANKSTDPRAYPNKSVSARMSIISAGVIMNLLFGWVCFIYLFTLGRTEITPVMGEIVAGSPAYVAGLRVGDEIVSIDGRRDPGFNTIQAKVIFAGRGHVLHMEVKRPGQKDLVGINVQPRREASSDRPTIGIRPKASLIVGDFEPPAGMSDPPAYPAMTPKDRQSKVDVLVAAGVAGSEPLPMTDYHDYEFLLAKNPRRPIVHRIERRLFESLESGPALETFEVTLPPAQFIDLGARFTAGPISAIAKDSPAQKAGLREGDMIVKVDGDDAFDPMRLPYYCFERAGMPVTFEIRRQVASGEQRTERITVTPYGTVVRMEPVSMDEPLDLSGVGLCYPVITKVAAVRPDSPTAKAGIKPGDVINSLTFPAFPAKPASSGHAAQPAAKALTVDFDETSPAWFGAFGKLQDRPIQDDELVVNKVSKAVTITPEPDLNWDNPMRGLRFSQAFRKLPPQDLTTAMRSGFDFAVENVLRVYATFRSLFQRQVSPKNLGGPLMIIEALYTAADSGINELISMLGFISVTLAVFNFLPVPPLDGGQMVFLVAEKVRGRPLPESAVITSFWIGFVMVIGLLLFVTYQDIFRWIERWLGAA